MVLMAVLSTGLIYPPQDEDDDLEQQYTPVGSPAKAEQCFVQEHFTANNSLIFFISRKCTEVNYASILVVSNTETPLEPEILEEISKVEGAWQALTVIQDNRTQIPYSKVCTKNQGSCVPPTHSCSPEKVTGGLNLKSITFPIYSLASQIINLANILGGTVLGESMGLIQVLLQAKALRLQYYLKTGEGEENERSKAWMIHFLMKVGSLEQSLALKKIKVLYMTFQTTGI
ncbi:hypothetical protein E5288_WYG019281 [Bos mutus]|uniref:Uncharacterized protein n=1 Tax=Bos mutus TaxID=72004 RepID=A0A6B0S9B0_9CETA|nr:hypothetical protein [Bos mutus]